jgi:hypothetical protein
MIAVIMVLSVCFVPNAFAASVWDNRDPEIQRGQAIIEGTAIYTMPALLSRYDKLESWRKSIPALATDNNVAGRIGDFITSMEDLTSQLDKLTPGIKGVGTIQERISQAKNEDYTLVANGPEIRKLLKLADMAGTKMSCVIRTMENPKYSCEP